MYIKLEFDFETQILYVPDGYIRNVRACQLAFFDWQYDRADNLVSAPGNGLAVAYGPNDFAMYINDVVLHGFHEIAYFVKAPIKGKVHTLRF